MLNDGNGNDVANVIRVCHALEGNTDHLAAKKNIKKDSNLSLAKERFEFLFRERIFSLRSQVKIFLKTTL